MGLLKQVVAVDIGGSKTAALVARPNDQGRLDVVSLAYVPSEGMNRGVIEDPETLGECLVNVLGKLERHLKQPVEEVWASISVPQMVSTAGQAMLPIFPAGREIKRQDLHQIMSDSRRTALPSGHEQILSVPRYYKVDGAKVNHSPLGRPAERLDITTHVVSAPAPEIAQCVASIQASGRRLGGFVPASLASGLGTLSSDGIELGAIIIDIGAERTEAAVFLDGSYAFQCQIPVGSNHISRDISQLINVEIEEGDRLKCDAGDAYSPNVPEEETVAVHQGGTVRPMQRRVLAEIIESRGREILEGVRKKLLGFAALEELPLMIVLTGGGSVLRGTEHLCEQVFPGKRCKVAQPKVTGRFSGQVASPMLATIVGVARYAIFSEEDDLAPISGSSSWRDRFRMLISKFDSAK